jgi:3-methylcrotonyl-CoA carboxylase alpha subunit
VLIANRGEIAVRVARTCRSMGIRSIAVYSDADAGALHARSCDEATPIGGVSARESYLRGDVIIEAAKRCSAEAIHPGYGFLSENADFAQACADARIAFIGPAPAAMRAVGDKISAKRIAMAAGVPVLPGYLDREQSREILEAHAGTIGAPLLIKAAAGGGGRGMRLVTQLSEFGVALEGAQREAQAAFGDPTVFLERYVASPRHIEVQIIADSHGACLTLGERECSIQRRYQKILEESPSPAVDAQLRRALEDAAVKLSRAVDYTNAGTVEFMLDGDDRFYFLEMNARLQVEHPVTEMVTGTDLVREQIMIASGGKLELERRAPNGHAIEVRIYAEDPAQSFLPSTGRITTFEPPQLAGIRNDVAVDTGSDVSPAYDPMLAKLIVHAATRGQSIERMAAALGVYLVGGVATNIAFLRWLVNQPAFKQGHTSTDFLDRHFRPDALADSVDADLAVLAGAGALQGLRSDAGSTPRADAWQRLGPWRHSASERHIAFAHPKAGVEAQWRYGESAWECRFGKNDAFVKPQGDGAFLLRSAAGEQRFAAWHISDGVAISLQGALVKMGLPRPPSDAAEIVHRHGAGAARGSVEAPMSGTIVTVNVGPGDAVKAFQVLLVMEAMKMEHAIVAPYQGTIASLRAQPGQRVAAGDALAEIAEA